MSGIRKEKKTTHSHHIRMVFFPSVFPLLFGKQSFCPSYFILSCFYFSSSHRKKGTNSIQQRRAGADLWPNLVTREKYSSYMWCYKITRELEKLSTGKDHFSQSLQRVTSDRGFGWEESGETRSTWAFSNETKLCETEDNARFSLSLSSFFHFNFFAFFFLLAGIFIL